jgi:hypothetical protein
MGCVDTHGRLLDNGQPRGQNQAMMRKLTGNDISGIHSIFIFNKTKAIHELDLSDLASAMSCEVVFDIRLGGYDVVSRSLLERLSIGERVNGSQ